MVYIKMEKVERCRLAKEDSFRFYNCTKKKKNRENNGGKMKGSERCRLISIMRVLKLIPLLFALFGNPYGKALSMTFEPRAVTSPCIITRILLFFSSNTVNINKFCPTSFYPSASTNYLYAVLCRFPI